MNVTERGRIVVLLETVGAVSVSSEEATEGGLEGFEERERARERVTRPSGEVMLVKRVGPRAVDVLPGTTSTACPGVYKGRPP